MKKVILKLLGAGALTALVGCVGVNTASADSTDILNAVDMGSASGTQLNVRLKRVLEVTMPTAVAIDVDPSSTGTGFGTGEVAVKIATNNPTGYNLSMYMVGDSADLKNSVPTYTRGIPTITSDGESDAFANTQVGWGWKLTQGDEALKTNYYRTVPAGQNNAETIAHTDTPTNDITTKVEFGVQVKDITLPSGVYTGTVNFVAVVNNVEYFIPEYMQDFDSSIADYMTEGQQYTIKDKRDEKTYYIAKLKDKNVWMTQNLDLVLSTNKTLKREDTDLNGSVYEYTPAVSTTTGNVYSDGNQYKGQNSWDGGNYYWNGTWISSANNSAGYGAFSSAFMTSVPNTQNAPAAPANAGNHYHVGNLYQWSAATAGSGDDLNNGTEASSSICPRGWRLPYSGDNVTDKSFGKLLGSYAIASNAAGVTALTGAPLFFVPGGNIGSGSLYSAGYGGYYWSSRSYAEAATNRAYSLDFNSSAIGPSNNNYRYYGFSIRCVAR